MIIPAIMYAWWGSQTVIIGGVLKSEEKNSFDILIIIFLDINYHSNDCQRQENYR